MQSFKTSFYNFLRARLKRTGMLAVARSLRKAKKVVMPKRDVFRHFDEILGHEHGATDAHTPAGSMTWVVPDFSESSGGHINIFRMMKMLQQRGFADQRVVILEPHQWGSAAEAKAKLGQYFGIDDVTVQLGIEAIQPSEYVFATSWQTAYWVKKFRAARHRCYFVQDFEPWFYAHGSEYALAEATYRLGLVGVTAGTWLQDHLASSYGMTTHGYKFSYDRDLYRRLPVAPQQRRRVFFYARPVTPRRCFELGLLALKQVCERLPDVSVVFAGWDVSDHEIPFQHQSAGQLRVEELPALYSSCDVALVLSASNLSLLPLEIAACGLPLVINDGDYANWSLPGDCAVYSPLDPHALAEAMIAVLADAARSAQMAERARVFAEATDWGVEADGVAAFLRQLATADIPA